jgi:hypothetical protein
MAKWLNLLAIVIFEDLFVLKVVIGSELIRERFVCCG